MSRSTMAGGPSRTLTLTEELEKLEQSITLTLQEIDSNFSRAHRIVTTSILPLVEQYGEQSRAVWEATKFWKQFFEASANVSLSGYEELANDDDENTMTGTADDSTALRDDTTNAGYTPPARPRSRGNNDTTVSGARGADESSDFQHQHRPDDSVLSDDGGTLTGSTPRPPATKSMSVRPQFAGLGSPYDLLQREMKQEAGGASPSRRGGAGGGAGGGGDHGEDGDEEDDTELLFQQHTARLPDMSMTPHTSSVPANDSAFLFSGQRPKPQDPLMHRVLDKNYRIAATPLKGGGNAGVSPIRWRVTQKPKDDTVQLNKGKDAEATRPIWADSPMSSPEIERPKLRSEAFMSPARPSAYRRNLVAATAAPRTPGVSVQTPATARKTRDVYARDQTPRGRAEGEGERETDEITWETSDDEDLDIYGGMSPPKTIQFALPPSKLLQTPAREASKRIVEDILMTAGAEPGEDSEYSPTMVKMNQDLLDDTF